MSQQQQYIRSLTMFDMKKKKKYKNSKQLMSYLIQLSEQQPQFIFPKKVVKFNNKTWEYYPLRILLQKLIVQQAKGEMETGIKTIFALTFVSVVFAVTPCKLTTSKTTNEFKVLPDNCFFDIDQFYVKHQLWYSTINDGRGALANSVKHSFYYPSGNKRVDTKPDTFLNPSNHHNGELLQHDYLWEHYQGEGTHNFYEVGTYIWNTQLQYVNGSETRIVLSQNMTFEIKKPMLNLQK